MIQTVEQQLPKIEELCRRYGVRRLELFGSAATGAFRENESDLDFLVEFAEPDAPGYSKRYFGLLFDLEALFGRQIDLVVGSAITNPYFHESVDEGKIPLYAA